MTKEKHSYTYYGAIDEVFPYKYRVLPVAWYFNSKSCSCSLIISMLCSTADFVSTGYCCIVFEVLTLKAVILIFTQPLRSSRI